MNGSSLLFGRTFYADKRAHVSAERSSLVFFVGSIYAPAIRLQTIQCWHRFLCSCPGI